MWEAGPGRQSTRLRDAMKNRPLLIPGSYDALSAKIVERAAFSATYVSSLSTVLSRLGLPDAGLASETEIVSAAAGIVDAVNIPVIADAETATETRST